MGFFEQPVAPAVSTGRGHSWSPCSSFLLFCYGYFRFVDCICAYAILLLEVIQSGCRYGCIGCRSLGHSCLLRQAVHYYYVGVRVYHVYGNVLTQCMRFWASQSSLSRSVCRQLCPCSMCAEYGAPSFGTL